MIMIGRRNFASDNNATVHSDILKAMEAANRGHAVAYGDDPWTERAVETFKAHFGTEAGVFFVFGGTGANVTGLAALLRPHQAVLCSEVAHIHVHECGAPGRFTGCKILPIAAPDGKLTVEALRPRLQAFGDPHVVQPGVISLTQATEVGTVYTPVEVCTLAEFAHRQGLKVHMDGARISNAAVHLGIGFAAFTRDVGVDVLSFGGTKNGLMFGEAVVVFDREAARDFPYLRTQGTQLPAKMRFIAAQFEAFLSGELWRRNAEHANAMARRLADGLRSVPQVTLAQKVEINGVFARIPRHAIPRIREKYFFYVLDEEQGFVRWMTAFDTTETDVDDFIRTVKESVE
jgi:threonine aldolase